MRIIAEFCQNHNGDFDILRRMIDAAAAGGATHGKVQTIFAGDLARRERFEEGKTDPSGRVLTIKRPYQPEYDRLKKLELTYEQHRAFGEACRNAGLEPLTTAFNLTCLPHLRELGWTAIKIASYDCGSLPLLEGVAATFNEIIVSTGATFDEEIDAAANTLKRLGKSFTFLHCVTVYPTPLDAMNLERMAWLRGFTPSVGLSDHSLVARDGIKAALAAIHLGADTIERHFTVLPEDQTRDGRVSIREEHLREIVAFSRLSPEEQQDYLARYVPEFPVMLGQRTRPLSHEEMVNRDYYRGRFCNKVDGRDLFNWEDEVRCLIPAA
ncbi:MAG TPA: N-acetylneuraminate synthase family protein [Azospirillum sp.]|nr:N-acetylneuraminate synthase family protein [Azospirillum sp.]